MNIDFAQVRATAEKYYRDGDFYCSEAVVKTIRDAFGWDATSDAMDEWMYKDLTKKFVLDKQFTEWAKEVNPWALQNITERLLEAIQRGMWNADEETKQKITQVYLEVEGDIEGYEDH